MADVIERIIRLPGNSFVEKLEYALWKKLGYSLAGRGIIYRNGEVIAKKSEISHKESHCESASVPRVICLTGFGHSGSGAVADLLSEYDGVTVQGFIDKNGSLRQTSGMEFDILRHAGGLFDLEKAVLSQNPFLQDAAVKSFMSLVAYYYYDSRCYYREALLKGARGVLDEIIDCKCPTKNGYEYNPHLRMLGDKGFDLLFGCGKLKQALFSLRQMQEAEYRSLVRRFILSMYPHMASSEYLLLDQIVSDCTADIKRYEEYLGPIKLMAVYRDPRDVFATGLILHEDWIPHDASSFVRWYRRQVEPYLSLSHDDYKLIRFEDLVLNYETTIKAIEGFVGIQSTAHNMQFKSFDPEVSSKNVGLYRSIDDAKNLTLISRELREFCFNE